jgi:hypothetical protein
MIAVAFSGIQDCFYDTIRHAKADYCQGIPQPPMKYHMIVVNVVSFVVTPIFLKERQATFKLA